MKATFNEDLKKAEQEFNIGQGGGKFKFQEGDNKIRIMSNNIALQSTFIDKKTGTPKTSVQFLTWVWNYNAGVDAQGKPTGALQLAFFAYSISKKLASLMHDPEYKFEEVPMPYDFNITAENAGKETARYTILPARSNSPVPSEALEALAKEKPIEEVRDAIAEKKNQMAPTPATEEVDVEETLTEKKSA